MLSASKAACRRILAAREIRRSMEAMRQAGSEVSYHAVDVRDSSALGSLFEGIYAVHGRIDGVIHGAGLLEDRLMLHKTAESFDRVYDTKVQGALNLAACLRRDVGFLVFFSSIAGVFGNRGQADYAAANDALDKIASSLRERLDGRVLSIAWGPWRGAGMVSPELEQEYARQGVGLIDSAEGAQEFLEELAAADGRDGPVILMRADPEWLG